MDAKLARKAVLLIAACLLTLPLMPPAAASNQVGGGTAVVGVNTTPLGYPLIHPSTSGSFTLSHTIACVGIVMSRKAALTATVGATYVDPPCSITGAGYFTGNCLRLSGSYTGTIIVGSVVVGFSGTFETAGSAVVLIGAVTSGGMGSVIFVGKVLPGPYGDCLSGTQVQLTMAGAFAFPGVV